MEEQRGLHLEGELRRALNHLSDPSFLRESELAPLLGLQDADDPAAALRAALEQAIEALKPISDTGPGVRTARYYEILHQRYVQQLTQRAVAQRLAITPRYLRREQSAAIRALAGYLSLRYDLAREQAQGIGTDTRAGTAMSLGINREMLWLADSLRGQTCDVNPTLSAAIELVQDLAQRNSVRCVWSQAVLLPPVHIPRTVLKQVVLNLLTAVIHELPRGGRVELAGQAIAEQVIITLTAIGESGHSWRQVATLEAPIAVSRQLAGVFKGDLLLSYANEVPAVRVILPCAGRQILVLAIEDNLDTLQLWRRYTQKTRFTLVAENNVEQAVANAVQLQPDLIVLDVMLPGIDGWEILHRLRANPATAPIPVIVCTVLPQRELALSLGARDFIPKPATGEEFRAALERQISAARLSQ